MSSDVQTRVEFRCNAATAGSQVLDTSTGHAKLDGLHGRDQVDDFEGDVSNAKTGDTSRVLEED